MEDMRMKFYQTIPEQPHSNLPRERYKQIVERLLAFQQDKSLKKEMSDYNLLRRYSVEESTNENGVFVRNLTKKGTSLRFVCFEDVFDVLHRLHRDTGHGRRNVLRFTVTKQYVNITREAIRHYLSLCDNCRIKRHALQLGLDDSTYDPSIFEQPEQQATSEDDQQKRRVQTLDFKRRIIEAADSQGVYLNKRRLAKQFGLAPSSLREILKRRGDVFDAIDKGTNPNRRKLRKVGYDLLEEAVLNWLMKFRERNDNRPISLSDERLSNKARHFCNVLGIDESQVCRQWLLNFRKRNCELFVQKQQQVEATAENSTPSFSINGTDAVSISGVASTCSIPASEQAPGQARQMETHQQQQFLESFSGDHIFPNCCPATTSTNAAVSAMVENCIGGRSTNDIANDNGCSSSGFSNPYTFSPATAAPESSCTHFYGNGGPSVGGKCFPVTNLESLPSHVVESSSFQSQQQQQRESTRDDEGNNSPTIPENFCDDGEDDSWDDDQEVDEDSDEYVQDEDEPSSSPVRVATNRRHKELPVGARRLICLLKQKHPQMTNAAVAEQVQAHFNLSYRPGLSTISKILLNEWEMWLDAFSDDESMDLPNCGNAAASQDASQPFLCHQTTKTIRALKKREVERALLSWIKDQTSNESKQRPRITDELIISQAKQMAKKQGILPEDFPISEPWLARFKSKHNLQETFAKSTKKNCDVNDKEKNDYEDEDGDHIDGNALPERGSQKIFSSSSTTLSTFSAGGPIVPVADGIGIQGDGARREFRVKIDDFYMSSDSMVTEDNGSFFYGSGSTTNADDFDDMDNDDRRIILNFGANSSLFLAAKARNPPAKIETASIGCEDVVVAAAKKNATVKQQQDHHHHLQKTNSASAQDIVHVNNTDSITAPQLSPQPSCTQHQQQGSQTTTANGSQQEKESALESARGLLAYLERQPWVTVGELWSIRGIIQRINFTPNPHLPPPPIARQAMQLAATVPPGSSKRPF